jgi:excisionase family DNA binding protein
LDTKAAAEYLHCGVRLVYAAAEAGALRHARLAGRKKLLFRREWLDQFVERTAEPQEVGR